MDVNTTNGLCECGCGQPAPIAKKNIRSRGIKKGESYRFIRGHNITMEHHPNWKGGKSITGYGYVRLRSPEHPNAVRGYVLEHRLVMEEALGRFLEPHETVHHKNGVKTDNRIENLELRVGAHGTGITHCPHCGESLTPVAHG